MKRNPTQALHFNHDSFDCVCLAGCLCSGGAIGDNPRADSTASTPDHDADANFDKVRTQDRSARLPAGSPQALGGPHHLDRVYIISALAGLPEADTAAQRLLQNQVDIGNAVKPFYGDQAGNQLTSLLKVHILTAADLLAAAKSGDNAKFEAANKSWYDNANQIAAMLNSANPDEWPLSDMQSMMKSHLDLTLEEATARLKQDWTGDIAAYDKVHDEILGMADMLSDGIIKQFPDKFAPQQASQQKIGLTLAMNKLWEDHVTWTRVYIMSVTSGLPDADAAAKRLLQNQVDIGNAIKPLYGEQAGRPTDLIAQRPHPDCC